MHAESARLRRGNASGYGTFLNNSLEITGACELA